MVEVLYFANIKDITQKSSEMISLQSCQVKDLMQELIARYPSLEGILWDEKSSSLKNNIAIAINHKMIPKDEYHSLELLENDKIAFLTPVSGG
jgi:MoaD family protein